MIDISKIKIVGIDDTNPPLVRKENYIDLCFKLSEQAPMDWCEDFNSLGRKIQPPTKIDPKEGIIVTTYVNDMNSIQIQLDKIKVKVQLCNEIYIEKIRQKELAEAARQKKSNRVDSQQERLNKIVAELVF